jgi:hypothetical protein
MNEQGIAKVQQAMLDMLRTVFTDERLQELRDEEGEDENAGESQDDRDERLERAAERREAWRMP